MKRYLVTACLYTALTALLLGIVYPIVNVLELNLALDALSPSETDISR